jgi:poly(beta-D-mannuronate) lyase
VIGLFLVALLSLGAMISSALTAEHRVSSAMEIELLAEKLQPGDVLLMNDGTWNNQAIFFRGKGTNDKPIIMRAQTPGKTVLVGESSLTIAGEYLTVSGLWLKEGHGAQNGVALAGRHCRVTETAVTDSTYKFFVHMSGSENRFDHCYLAGKTSESPTLQVEAEGQPNHHRIDRNHFGPRPPLGRNGGETIRVGYSGQSMNTSGTVVEENFFARCDGENEIISSKSCENVYRANTFRDCAGMLTLRHGNRCRVEGNFFFGAGKKGSGGIRVIGEDHVVINNYIDNVDEGGIWITSGIPDSPLNGYFCARRCLIAFNTIVNSCGPALDLNAGFGTSRRSLRPVDITIANNLFSVPKGGALLKGMAGNDFKWVGNIATCEDRTDGEQDGIRMVDPKLERALDGLLRPSLHSPARGAAEGDFSSIATDIDGQARVGRRDVGCDQLSDAPIIYRPLHAADVGPSWMDRREPSTKRAP